MNVTNFKFRNIDLRCVEIDGEPWFVAADVCRVLDILNVANAVRPLADTEKTIHQIKGMRGPAAKLISESGLYKLVMRSDKPQAKDFQDWVTAVVLPAIRKDGGYIEGEEKVATGEMSEDELVLKALQVMQTKLERLREENRKLAEANAEMDHELNLISVDEFRALKHQYWNRAISSRMGWKCKKLGEILGITPVVQERIYETVSGRLVPTTSKVWPRHLIEQAYNHVKLDFPHLMYT